MGSSVGGVHGLGEEGAGTSEVKALPETAAGAQGGSGESPAAPPHPASYMEVLEMLEKGITPPGIRVRGLHPTAMA